MIINNLVKYFCILVKKMKKQYLILLSLTLLSFMLIPGVLDLNDVFDYENLPTPNYINKNNTTTGNEITNSGATLGRVLFYDKSLSSDESIACASCHLQEFAFGDTEIASTGVNGTTGRHSMRLINTKYTHESQAFWNERAITFEEQATMPIKDHIEMGFSGEDGDPTFEELIDRLTGIEYYPVLFEFTFGDSEITEQRIQKSLTQFIKSIESFDSKYDEGRAQVSSNYTNFPNFTSQENLGKLLFFNSPSNGGAGCFRCHSGSEISIVTHTSNNGIIGVIGDETQVDLFNTKAPTLRDLINPQGEMNGPLMHNGSLNSLMEVVNHYNDLEETEENPELDSRLFGPNNDLNLSQQQKEALIAFLETLTGSNVYTAEQWSNPFDENGDLVVIPVTLSNDAITNNENSISLYPNPATNQFSLALPNGNYEISIINFQGKEVKKYDSHLFKNLNISDISPGIYFVIIKNTETKKVYFKKLIKT